MGVAEAISEASDTLLENLAQFLQAECFPENEDNASAEPEEIMSALKAWAYMNMNSPDVD